MTPKMDPFLAPKWSAHLTKKGVFWTTVLRTHFDLDFTPKRAQIWPKWGHLLRATRTRGYI